MFLVFRTMNELRREVDKKPETESAPSREVQLLEEISDALVKRDGRSSTDWECPIGISSGAGRHSSISPSSSAMQPIASSTPGTFTKFAFPVKFAMPSGEFSARTDSEVPAPNTSLFKLPLAMPA